MMIKAINFTGNTGNNDEWMDGFDSSVDGQPASTQLQRMKVKVKKSARPSFKKSARWRGRESSDGNSQNFKGPKYDVTNQSTQPHTQTPAHVQWRVRGQGSWNSEKTPWARNMTSQKTFADGIGGHKVAVGIPTVPVSNACQPSVTSTLRVLITWLT